MSTIQLTYYCDSCKAENHLETKAPTRSELENIRGSYFYEQCNKCLKSHRYHVNDVKAKSNMNFNVLVIAGLLSLLIAFSFYLLNLGFISTLTIGIPLFSYFLYMNQVNNSVSIFNHEILNRNRDYKPPKK